MAAATTRRLTHRTAPCTSKPGRTIAATASTLAVRCSTATATSSTATNVDSCRDARQSGNRIKVTPLLAVPPGDEHPGRLDSSVQCVPRESAPALRVHWAPLQTGSLPGLLLSVLLTGQVALPPVFGCALRREDDRVRVFCWVYAHGDQGLRERRDGLRGPFL